LRHGGRGGSNKAGEAKDILGTISGGRGGDSAVANAWGRRQRQLLKLPLPPSLVSQTSLARDVMARLLSSSSSSSLPFSSPGGGRYGGSPGPTFAFMLRECSNVCWVLTKLQLAPLGSGEGEGALPVERVVKTMTSSTSMTMSTKETSKGGGA
jgi:hypothetical protein